ncbi:hypothetical protein PR202_gb18054 [Eleusine coracana subsp. coracana]|uniref:KIB1-4 beta-propeller domain-containing protein n=1 Tax=Eleusine coracana subsp. coracana TaxID=191504 RepID=A0AAV5F2B3_ELECO|nr:hypothetical protein PR202_gb17987 [Eleusine coracana subsp. coracana]GJN29799.1 hypothetical protein PR202_gb18054 [Eleusine coracana subsp. coracana]
MHWFVIAVYYLDVDGELYTACVVHYHDDVNSVAGVSVYRMDFERKKPVRVKDIGDRAILAGSSSPFGGWCPATEFGLLPNTVYWMSPEDKRLHVFDIGTGKERVIEPCKGVVAEPSRQPFWMIPEHS